jgi:hypothetical protein
MDRGEYYRKAKELLRLEHAAIEAIFAGAVDEIIARKKGAPADPDLALPILVARHQAVVAEMASLGEEFWDCA